MTLTAIRATVIAAASPTDVASTPELTEVSAPATSIQEATPIAPANMTLTAIRATVIAAASPTDVAATLAPTEVSATATSIREATPIAPANMTLTAIRETVIAAASPTDDAATPEPTANGCRDRDFDSRSDADCAGQHDFDIDRGDPR